MGEVDMHPNAQKQLEAPVSLDINKIKDPTKLIIKHDQVLIKRVIETKVDLILVEGTTSSSLDKLIVVKVGNAVKNYKPGDLVLDVLNPRGVIYMHKKVDGKEENYALTTEFNINLATNEDNIKE